MKRAWTVTAILVAVSVVVDIATLPFAHPEFWWHTVPGFDLLFGFLGCGAIVYGSKWLGHKFVMRDEDYYERDP